MPASSLRYGPLASACRIVYEFLRFAFPTLVGFHLGERPPPSSCILGGLFTLWPVCRGLPFFIEGQETIKIDAYISRENVLSPHDRTRRSPYATQLATKLASQAIIFIVIFY